MKLKLIETILSNLKVANQIAIKEIDLSRTHVSGRSLLQCSRNGTIIPTTILSRIERIDWSNTSISSEGLKFTYLLSNLKILELDGCKNVKDILGLKNPCPSVQEITILGTSCIFKGNWLKKLEQKFPKIRILDLTQTFSKSNKFLGVKYGGKTAIYPLVYEPCGHVVGSPRNLFDIVAKTCIQCQEKIEQSHGAAFPITRFEKKENTWKVRILDITRRDLKGRLFFHAPCAHLYTIESINEIFKIKIVEKSDAELVNSVAKFNCPGCISQKKCKLLRIYPELTEDKPEEQSMSKNNLNNVSMYTNTY